MADLRREGTGATTDMASRRTIGSLPVLNQAGCTHSTLSPSVFSTYNVSKALTVLHWNSNRFLDSSIEARRLPEASCSTLCGSRPSLLSSHPRLSKGFLVMRQRCTQTRSSTSRLAPKRVDKAVSTIRFGWFSFRISSWFFAK